MALPQVPQVSVNCGKRLLPSVIDQIAVTDPKRIFASIPATSKIEDGFVDINYRDYARAVNTCAWWLKEKLGEQAQSQVVLYLGPLDLRYLIIIIAAAKAGHIVSSQMLKVRVQPRSLTSIWHQAFFSSHRNSLEAHLSLIEKSKCNTILLPEQAPAIVKQILDERPMHVVETPDAAFFLDESKGSADLPFDLTWEQGKDKPFCVLHTSGSTGIPKPVFVKYGTFACNDAHQLIPSMGGKRTLVDHLKGKRYFVALPLFHAACLTFTLGYNVFAGVICVLPPPAPLTADLANKIFTHGNLYGALMAPSLIVDCYNNDEYCVNMIKRLEFLSYVGGALPEEVGDPLSTRIKLTTLMGSCETALHPLEMDNDPADWQYLSISPYLGHEFRLGKDGLYELIIIRQDQYRLFQGVFSTFPEKDEFASGDLFEPHPTKLGKFVFRARADDIIAFTTAEKLNPITMESIISANHHVKSALIGGQGQFQASLLIEPRLYPKDATKEEALLKEIWPSIAQANRGCPAHGRIMKGFVMLTNPDKPLPRAGKDTVQRHAALKLYAEEFNALYRRMRPHVIAPPDPLKSTPRAVNGVDKMSPPMAASSEGTPYAEPVKDTTQLPPDLDAIIEKAVEKHLQSALAKLLSNLLEASQSIKLPKLASNGLSHEPEARSSPTSVPNGVGHSSPDTASPTSRQYKPTDDSLSDLRKLIYDTLAENLSIDDITDDSDLFQCGLDSIQVPGFLNTVNAYLIKNRPGVSLIETKALYENPSVGQILKAMER